MALTDRGKQQAMSVGIRSTTRYITLHLANGTQLSGHGYTPQAITTAQMTVSAAGVITGPANLVIYAANDDSSQRAVQVGLAENTAGTTMLYEPENLDDVGTDGHPQAPVNTQEFRLTLTLNP